MTAVVLGNDQGRALRRAVTTAVQLTARELDPAGDSQAGQLAMVISEVFGMQVSGGAANSLAGQATLLNGLQAGWRGS